MVDSYLDELNDRVREVSAETVRVLAAESARLLASCCGQLDQATNCGELIEIFRLANRPELLPEHFDILAAEFARLYRLKNESNFCARPSVWMILDDHIFALCAACAVALAYFIWLMMQHPRSPDFDKQLADLVVAGSRPGAVWAAFERQRQLSPGYLIAAFWMAAFGLVLWRARPRITSVFVVALVPLVVPIFFGVANVVTIESRVAAFSAGEQYAYATLMQNGSPMLKYEVQNFWDLRLTDFGTTSR